MLRLALTLFLVLPLSGAWLTNLDEGKRKAAEEGKEIYLVFTSLKISGACVQLKKRVLSQEEFQTAVAARLILVHLDVPLESKPGMVSPLAVNRLVAQNFGVEAYPTAFFLNSDGITYAKETGALTGGPLKYADRILKTSSEQAGRERVLAEAYQKEGLERAKAIIEVIKNASSAADPKLYAKPIAELAQLDPDDTLGFQKKRLAEQGFVELDRSLKEVFHKNSYGEVVKLVDSYLEKFEPQGALLQKALFPKLAALNHGNQIPEAIKAAGEVIAVDANSSYGKFAAQILKQLKAR
jgi:hypothetical protein